MYCTKCGNEINDGQLFCSKCGAKAPVNPGIQPMEKSKQKPKKKQKQMQQSLQQPQSQKIKKSKKGPVIAICSTIAIVLLALAAGVGVINYQLNKNFNQYKNQIAEYNIPCYTTEAEAQNQLWSTLKVWEIPDKKALLEKMNQVQQETSEADAKFTELSESLTSLTNEKENYKLADSYSSYEDALAACKEAIEKRDWENVTADFEKADQTLQEVIKDNDSYVEDKVAEYEALDVSKADKGDCETLNADIEKMQTLKKNHQYAQIEDMLGEMDEIYWQYAEPEKQMNVSIQQVDASGYPDVKLYLKLEDSSTGEIPEDLISDFFYIRKKDANGDYIKQTIKKVNQLNELEAMKVNMVADISGSMDGTPLAEAKQIMCDFIDTVQFNAGDEVELTTFSTGVYLAQEFCNNESWLKSKINGLYTGDMTSLYDALYTAVTRTASQSGAKCVIAFTDGMDNYSDCTADQVIEVSNRYHVPIFMIGIGMDNYTEARYIAQQTGGQYYNASAVSSMQAIYENIYRQEKELYMVEFTEEDSNSMEEEFAFIAGYHSKEYGGDCSYSYVPNILMNVNTASFYTSGPEAVVEAYMKNFDTAMTQEDFSYIAPYLKQNSNIYNSQKKYVTKGISEMLYSCEISDVDYENANRCIVTTRETYYVQKENQPLQLMTQQCQYVVECENGEWKMTDFASNVKVLFRINR